ncbi:hypothetical protein LguiA_033782 [Lonicera macranthoides]
MLSSGRAERKLMPRELCMKISEFFLLCGSGLLALSQLRLLGKASRPLAQKWKLILVCASNAYDILLNAMKATAPEKAQETSGTTRPLPKDKGNTYVTRRMKN